MKLRTATLCLPILVISVQQNAVNMTLPPFLDVQRYPVATIGTRSPTGDGLCTGSIAPGFAIGGLGAGSAIDRWGYPANFVAEGIGSATFDKQPLLTSRRF